MGYAQTRDIARKLVDGLEAEGVSPLVLAEICSHPALVKRLADLILDLRPSGSPQLLKEIESAAMSVRLRNCLARENYHWIINLCLATEDELLDIRNLGEGSMNEARVYLAPLH